MGFCLNKVKKTKQKSMYNMYYNQSSLDKKIREADQLLSQRTENTFKYTAN